MSESSALGRGMLSPASATVLVVVAAVLVGCPTYEDRFSGTYRETNVDAVRRQQTVEVDFFRFGRFARAVLRFYEPRAVANIPDRPYDNETFCTRTQVSRFDPDRRSFSLGLRDSSRTDSGRMRGRIVEGDKLELAVFDSQTGDSIVERKTLVRQNKRPSDVCDMPGDFRIRPTFRLADGSTNAIPGGTDYEVDNPVFTLRWVGLKRERGDNGNSRLLPKNAAGPSLRIGGGNFDPATQTFDGDLEHLLVPPPPESIRLDGGETRYAIGHFVVVDDQQSSGRFRWQPSEEPIVASSLERGRRPGAPSSADGFGKALLFVEGSVEELEDLPLEGVDRVGEGQIPDSHFYLVDVDVRFLRNRILGVILPRSVPDYRSRSVPLKATVRHLDDERSRLPRLFPLDGG